MSLKYHKSQRDESSVEDRLDDIQVRRVSKNTYEVTYGNQFSVYLQGSSKEPTKTELASVALQVLYDLNKNENYNRQTTAPLEALLPTIERVPDGSLGGGSDGYGRAWAVLGTYTPSQNKIRLVNSAGDHVLNHELGHWYAFMMGMNQPTREIAEQLAEKHQHDGRSLFDSIKTAQKDLRYVA